MDDSDEYFEDSIELDEAALASIQATEERFGASLSQAQTAPSRLDVVPPPPQPRSSPPPKRFKTNHGWIEPVRTRDKSQSSMQPFLRNMDYDPEIHVNPDGSYALKLGDVGNTKTITRVRAQNKQTIEAPEPASSNSDTEVTSLRAQLSELTAALEAAQQSLNEARDDQFLKAGEVSNLRRTIEKAAREHAEALAKVKEEKEAAERTKAELQAKLIEETDRMTTRLIFKQHELETSTRKRSRIYATPASRSPSYAREDRNRQFSSPSRNLEEDMIKQPVFKGFQNAFMDSAPVLAKSPRKSSDKIPRADEEDQFFRSGGPTQGEAAGITEPDPFAMRDNDKEVLMEVDEEVREDSQADAIGWAQELRRIIFTHTAPRTDVLTLQTLLSTTLPVTTSLEKRREFSIACRLILGTSGAQNGVRRIENFDGDIFVGDNVASAFITVCERLSDAGCIEPLVAILDLMSMLCLNIPAFPSLFFRPSQLLSMVETIVRDRFSLPRAEVVNAETTETTRVDLAMAIVQLMETLYWNVKDGHEEQSRVLEALLFFGHPPKLITRTLRLLVLIATHDFTFRSRISYKDKAESVSKNDFYGTLMGQLGQYLASPLDDDSCSIQRLILIFLTLFCDKHHESSNVLGHMISFVPPVTVCATRLSKLLWEENLDDTGSPEQVNLIVETLYLSTNFLHRLVFSSEEPPNLTHILMGVTHLPGPYNGITHMFMVTLGRLSWVEAPEWLSSDCKGTCEIISELATEVLETIVIGPEFDSLWTVWHPEENLDDEVD